MKNVLIVNQSSELYGADKALLELLNDFPPGFVPIVVLEHEGPLKEILLEKGIEVIKCPVIKLNRASMGITGAMRLTKDFFKSMFVLARAGSKLRIDLVHSNAISVFAGGFYSFFHRKPHLWHVHEIVESPKIVAKMYPKLVSLLSDKIIFNSKASFLQFKKIKPSVEKKSSIVYNGQDRNTPFSDRETVKNIKQNLFLANPEHLVIGLVGRISRWKGQSFLLNAFEQIHAQRSDVHLVFVGSTPPDQDHFLDNLEKEISDKNLTHCVTIVGFEKNIWPIYDAMDICTVPSIEPEPFGLVATEAMLSQKPVVASAHGGLTEIVVDGETGYLVKPSDVDQLASRLMTLIDDATLRSKMGKAGFDRVHTHFSAKRYAHEIGEAYKKISDGQ